MKKILITLSMVVFLAGLLTGQAQAQIPCNAAAPPECKGDCPLGQTCVEDPAGGPCFCQDAPQPLDFGDAPEGALAYLSPAVIGAFPTCITVGPALWVEHDNFGAYFGPLVDFELDGNGGLCPTFTTQ